MSEKSDVRKAPGPDDQHGSMTISIHAQMCSIYCRASHRVVHFHAVTSLCRPHTVLGLVLQVNKTDAK